MSDDDYYANSPYDEYDDLLWDDNASQDLAGDLAEHTLHSPVWPDDPGYELLQGYSDWEYYSDDYYDDDPSLLKGNPQDGSPLSRSKAVHPQATNHKRCKKRKLVETKDIPPITLDERNTLENCIVGTVWAKPRSEEMVTYREGQSKKVSLLKNWRDVFRPTSEHHQQSAKTSARRKITRDESWANDMSLEDMGLSAAKGPQYQGDGTGVDDDGDEEDHEEQDAREVQDDQDYGELSDSILDSADFSGDVYSNKSDGSIHDGDNESGPRKRQNRKGLPSPPPSNQSRANESIGESRSPVATSQSTKLPARRSTGQPAPRNEPQSPLTSSGGTARDVTSAVKSRKRRASSTKEEMRGDGTFDNPRMLTRAKRVASSKLSTKADTTRDGNVPPVPILRSARNVKR